MSSLIPFSRRNTLQDWIYDIDKFFEPFQAEQKPLILDGDIEECDEHILMSFDFPGMKQGDFNIKVEANKLTLSGERKRDRQEGEGEKFSFYGRQFGSFRKVFALPTTVDQSKIEADYRDGVLRIVLPKFEKEKPQTIDVKLGQNVESSFFTKLFSK